MTTTTRRPFRPMTERQAAFIRDLARERSDARLTVTGKTLLDQIVAGSTSIHVSTRTASDLIDVLLSSPKKGTVAAPAGMPGRTPAPSKWGEIHEILADVPVSRFAIPDPTDPLKTQWYRLSTWQGRRRFNKIGGGSSAGFHRVPATQDELLAAAKIIALNPLEAALRFGREHGVCSRCAVGLTDERSRRAGFGHDCAKAMGVTW